MNSFLVFGPSVFTITTLLQSGLKHGLDSTPREPEGFANISLNLHVALAGLGTFSSKRSKDMQAETPVPFSPSKRWSSKIYA